MKHPNNTPSTHSHVLAETWSASWSWAAATGLSTKVAMIYLPWVVVTVTSADKPGDRRFS